MLLVETQLPKPFSAAFKVFHLLELFGIFTLICITSWDLFKFFCNFLGLTRQEWLEDKQKMEWSEYHPQVFLLRGLYFGVLFILSLPFMFIKQISQQKAISLCFITTLIVTLILFSIENPFRYHINKQRPDYEVTLGIKSLKLEDISVFFSLIMSYYVQPFILSLKKEMDQNKVKNQGRIICFSVLSEILIYIFIGGLTYLAYGDNLVPSLLIYRPASDQVSKALQAMIQFFLLLFFLSNNFGMAVFTPTIKGYLNHLVSYPKNKIAFIGGIPFVVGFSMTLIFPSITQMFWVLGLIVCNFSGYIVPCLLKIHQKDGGKTCKAFALVLALFYFTAGCVGTYVKIN